MQDFKKNWISLFDEFTNSMVIIDVSKIVLIQPSQEDKNNEPKVLRINFVGGSCNEFFNNSAKTLWRFLQKDVEIIE